MTISLRAIPLTLMVPSAVETVYVKSANSIIEKSAVTMVQLTAPERLLKTVKPKSNKIMNPEC